MFLLLFQLIEDYQSTFRQKTIASFKAELADFRGDGSELTTATDSFRPPKLTLNEFKLLVVLGKGSFGKVSNHLVA